MPSSGGSATEKPLGTMNSFGYSPYTLSTYLDMLASLGKDLPKETHTKTAIVSVTGTPAEIAACYNAIVSARQRIPFPLAMEINLSCPNIPSAPPPAYDPAASLGAYLADVPDSPAIPVGIKTPPYTYARQFTALIEALRPLAPKVSFITATNTLGSCLVLDSGEVSTREGNDSGSGGERSVLPSVDGLGGMAGPGLHPLALGNVSTLRRLVAEMEELQHVVIIGVGGVSCGDGYRRMRRAGARFVALASGLGCFGVKVFERIEGDIDASW